MVLNLRRFDEGGGSGALLEVAAEEEVAGFVEIDGGHPLCHAGGGGSEKVRRNEIVGVRTGPGRAGFQSEGDS